jgi:predicted lipoprotein with Yx(FWY)xxD motif
MNIRPLVALAATAALVTLQACSSLMGGAEAPAKMADGMLVGPNGMTLYTFDKDAAGSGKSVCNGPCANNWPPLMAAAGAPMMSGDYSVITRDDGGKQWAMKGKPLYYWVKDTKPGDKTGDGFNGVWHVVK